MARVLLASALLICVALVVSARDMVMTAARLVWTTATDHAAIVAVLGTIALSVGSIMLLVYRQRAKNQRRDLDEAMRDLALARRSGRDAIAEPNSGTELNAPVDAAPPIYDNSLDADLGTDARIVPASAATSRTEPTFAVDLQATRQKLTVGERQHFLPFFDAESGLICGYETSRTGRRARGSDAIFLRQLPSDDTVAKARFDISNIEAVASDVRRHIEKTAEQGNMLVLVPVSSALLTHEPSWRSVCDLFVAHPPLRRLLNLSLSASDLTHLDAGAIKALQRCESRGVRFSLHVDGPVSEAMLQQFANQPDHVTISVRAIQSARAPDALKGMHPEGAQVWISDIVCEADMVEALSVEASAVAGPLFSRPRPLRAGKSQTQPFHLAS